MSLWSYVPSLLILFYLAAVLGNQSLQRATGSHEEGKETKHQPHMPLQLINTEKQRPLAKAGPFVIEVYGFC